MVTLLGSIVEKQNSAIYQQITRKPIGANEVSFGSSYTDEMIFEHIPTIVTFLLPKSSVELNRLTNKMYKTVLNDPFLPKKILFK